VVVQGDMDFSSFAAMGAPLRKRAPPSCSIERARAALSTERARERPLRKPHLNPPASPVRPVEEALAFFVSGESILVFRMRLIHG